MKLQLRANTTNLHPLKGILLRGNSPLVWVMQLQKLGLKLNQHTIYPLPYRTANSAWGCLVVSSKTLKGSESIGLQEFAQCIGGLLFIPEKAQILPQVSPQQLKDLLQGRPHLLHPEIGLVELTPLTNWANLIHPPVSQKMDSSAAAEGVFMPQTIRSFQVQAVEPETVIQQLAEGDFPEKKKLTDKPLNLLEKGKLALYQQLFGEDKPKTNQDKEGAGNSENGEAQGLLQGMDKLGSWLSGKQSGSWANRWKQDFEELAKRNQNELEKLMDLLKNNPLEALKYAIPLDESGTSRGLDLGSGAAFNLFKRWNDFGLFGQTPASGRGSGGWSSLEATQFWRLQEQYRKTAVALIEQGDYKKAAFVYLKLLKDYQQAAATLEKGQFYQEAASIYLKYVKDELKAAACYEKAHCLEQAIELYVKNNRNEKVGDLYLRLNNRQEANHYYSKVAEAYKKRHQHVKASLIYRNKMELFDMCQATLLSGWQGGYDRQNCLNQYFSNTSLQDLADAIALVHQQEVQEHNGAAFLQVLKYQFKRPINTKTPTLKPLIRQIAYEIIEQQLATKPSIVSELTHFNPNDQILGKDILRYRLKNR